MSLQAAHTRSVGRKKSVRHRWTRTELWLAAWFLLLVVSLVFLGMYVGLWNLEQEDHDDSWQWRAGIAPPG